MGLAPGRYRRGARLRATVWGAIMWLHDVWKWVLTYGPNYGLAVAVFLTNYISLKALNWLNGKYGESSRINSDVSWRTFLWRIAASMVPSLNIFSTVAILTSDLNWVFLVSSLLVIGVVIFVIDHVQNLYLFSASGETATNRKDRVQAFQLKYWFQTVLTEPPGATVRLLKGVGVPTVGLLIVAINLVFLLWYMPFHRADSDFKRNLALFFVALPYIFISIGPIITQYTAPSQNVDHNYNIGISTTNSLMHMAVIYTPIVYFIIHYVSIQAQIGIFNIVIHLNQVHACIALVIAYLLIPLALTANLIVIYNHKEKLLLSERLALIKDIIEYLKYPRTTLQPQNIYIARLYREIEDVYTIARFPKKDRAKNEKEIRKITNNGDRDDVVVVENDEWECVISYPFFCYFMYLIASFHQKISLQEIQTIVEKPIDFFKLDNAVRMLFSEKNFNIDVAGLSLAPDSETHTAVLVAVLHQYGDRLFEYEMRCDHLRDLFRICVALRGTVEERNKEPSIEESIAFLERVQQRLESKLETNPQWFKKLIARGGTPSIAASAIVPLSVKYLSNHITDLLRLMN
jgi:hypothetical protein